MIYRIWHDDGEQWPEGEAPTPVWTVEVKNDNQHIYAAEEYAAEFSWRVPLNGPDEASLIVADEANNFRRVAIVRDWSATESRPVTVEELRVDRHRERVDRAYQYILDDLAIDPTST